MCMMQGNEPYKHYDYHNRLNYNHYVAWSIINKTYYNIYICQVLRNNHTQHGNQQSLNTNHAFWQYNAGMNQGL